MTYETLWTGIGGGLLIPILGKLNLFHLIIQLVIDVKWIGLCLMKNNLDHLFPQIWISAFAVSLLLKLPVRKLEPIFVLWKIRCLKCVQIRSLFWSLFSRIQCECGKIRTRKNPVFGHFSRSDLSSKITFYLNKSTIRSCMEYRCLIWISAPSYYLDIWISHRNKYLCINHRNWLYICCFS